MFNHPPLRNPQEGKRKFVGDIVITLLAGHTTEFIKEGKSEQVTGIIFWFLFKALILFEIRFLGQSP
jgi:hypothetical protein